MTGIAAAVERARWTGGPPLVEDENGLFRQLTEDEVAAGQAELSHLTAEVK